MGRIVEETCEYFYEVEMKFKLSFDKVNFTFEIKLFLGF
jgi:hypothetical protein